jgi:cob(I)alamin adenosyltransferase
MLYTRKGDAGKTTTFGCNQSISKSSAVAEALGSLDETNSFLGVLRAKNTKYSDVVLEIQQNLFIIQAEVAGSDKSITEEKIKKVENVVDAIEKVLPPITTFFLSGANEISALFDFARTLSRRAERRVVAVQEEGKIKITPETLSYLNRLSSLLYALARISGQLEGKEEIKPSYK